MENFGNRAFVENPTSVESLEICLDKIRTFSSSPDILVRNFAAQRDLEGLVSTISTSEQLLAELTTGYSLNIPEHLSFVSYSRFDESKFTAYSLVERVYGRNLLDLGTDEAIQAVPLIGDMFSSLLSYYDDKQRNGGLFLSDIDRPEQYVLGHTNRNKDLKVYLVDIDPYFSSAAESSEPWGLRSYYLRNSILIMEKRYGIELTQSRLKSDQILRKEAFVPKARLIA